MSSHAGSHVLALGQFGILMFLVPGSLFAYRCMDDKEKDSDWHCHLEEKGGDDIDADDEEKESASLNNIWQVVVICY